MSSGQGYSQESRWLRLTSPLDPDTFLPLRLTGREAVSELFEYTLQLGSEVLSIDATTIVSHPVTVEIPALADGTGCRYIHGVVRRFSAGNIVDGKRLYSMRIVPALWRLTRTRDSRIFQNATQTVQDIIQEVLDEYEITNDLQLDGHYPNVEYCVQYQESAFDFLSRLMEAAGIFYYFKHGAFDHTLVVTDQLSNFPQLEPPELQIQAHGTGVNESIEHWEHIYEFRAGKIALTDYEFLDNFPGTAATPADNLLATQTSNLGLEGQTDYEIFEYPGGHQLSDDGHAAAEIRLQEEEAQYNTVAAVSSYRAIEAGFKFNLRGHESDEENTLYAILSCEIQADATHQYSSNISVAGRPRDFFTNRFTCIPDVNYRPLRKTPKPRIFGTQTAVVVGGNDEEIHTDEQGRIQIQFFWDRLSQRNTPGQYWVRCAQSIAGKNWGGIFIPRVGQEVVVTFLEGDPDRPLVTGVVYNGEQLPPYALPDNKTQSGFKTMSTTKGDASTFNELRFEDKIDSEEIYFHAERDFNRVVENNDSLKVGFEKQEDGNQTIDVFNNQTITIGASDASDGSQSLTVKTDRTITVQEGDNSLTVDKGNRAVTVSQGNDELTVSQGDRSVSIDTGNDTLTVQSGNLTIEVSAGTATIEAGQTIELKVGGNSITIDNSGITISGTTVTVEGEASVEVTSPASEVNGDGTLTLSGGTISLN